MKYTCKYVVKKLVEIFNETNRELDDYRLTTGHIFILLH